MSTELFDVAIVGYGPVSETLAIALARQGRRVCVVERWTERYPLPRAVCIDHELYRVLCALGMSRRLPEVSHAGPMYRWFNADWQELLAIDWQSESISGGPQVNFVHQPTLEQMFDDVVRAHPNVTLHLGCEAVHAAQDAQGVTLRVKEAPSDRELTLRAKYLIGADGANSLVRRLIGAPQEDRGFEADWLVVDVLPHEGVTLDVPPAAQWCNPARPTTIVPAGVKDGRQFRRWEFMRLPGESRESLESDARAWELLAPWVTPAQARIVRHKVYTFRSLLAQGWRQGRMLIAGDAAHVMPPFMGQGMCAGLRDAWNLAWKLDLILDGRADDALLDSYEPERRPHVSDVIDLSMYLGRMICVPDAAQAERRDAAFLSGTATPPPPFPSMTDGLLRRDAGGAVVAPAGLLAPHGRVRDGAVEGRFDDVAGLGFMLISRQASALSRLSAAQRTFLDRLRVRRVVVAASGAAPQPGVLADLDDKFLPFMDRLGIDSMLVRPDFHLYGAVGHGDDLGSLVDDLRLDLARHGVDVGAGNASEASPRSPQRRRALGRLSAPLFTGLAALGGAGPVLAQATAASTPASASATASATAPRCACGLIDAHSHFLPPVYAQALADAGLIVLDGGFPVPAWSEQRALDHMNWHGIETSMLSVSSPTVSFLSDKLARGRLARAVNEFAGDLVRRQPRRFGAFATLPLPDIDAAIEEIGYALDVLKLDGVVMETNVHGIYLGDPRLEPVFSALNKRKATVFLHPTSPPCLKAVGLGRPAPILEFPMDTARTVTDLIFAGTLTRHPDLKLIVPHAGGALTALVDRIAGFSTLPFLKQRPEGGAAEVRQLLANLHYDLAASANEAAIERLRRIVPMTRVLFGSDFPFTPAAGIEANVQGFRGLRTLSRAEHEDLARNNALALFPRLRAAQA